MPTYTTIPETAVTEQVTDTFGGYNHNLKIDDGEFYDMRNLTSDYYPLMGNRAARSLVQSGVFATILGMTADSNGDLYVIGRKTDSEMYTARLYRIYKNSSTGKPYSMLEDMTAITYDDYANLGSRVFSAQEQLLFFNDELMIFPSGIRVKTKKNADGYYFSHMLEMYSQVLPATTTSELPYIQIRPCNSDGELITGTASATAPAAPTEGTVWIDTSDGVVWKKYTSSMWVVMQDVYVRITIVTSGTETYASYTFPTGDAVKISSIVDNKEDTIGIEGTHIIIKSWVDSNTVEHVITGVISASKTLNTNGDVFTMLRQVPDMDFVIQAQNRLWGCHYREGEGANGKGINEIYACKLGDASNWNVFQGLSTDSYAASCGTPGKFTGAANVNGYPIFFKENCFHKVYISSSGAHQIVDKNVQGVQDGCGGSVTVIGDICYYKARGGVMAFDGSQAYNISEALGDVKYIKADGGNANGKYYISLKDVDGQWTIFAYDIQKGMWCKEDEAHATLFTSSSSDAFYTIENLSGSQIYLASDYLHTDTPESGTGWEAITGMQGYNYTGQKYISRFNLRMMLPKGSGVDVYIEYDSSGKWEHQGHIKGTGTTTFMLPVRPRRCDHFRIKLSGTGTVRLYSISKLFEGGTDIK